MNGSRLALCVFVALLIVSVGCGGGSGNDVVETPPADVSGGWAGVVNNAGSAILSGCTGDFASFNGLTVAGASSGSNCADSGPLVMTQSGTSLTAVAVNYACDNGDYGSRAGGGTVAGQSVSGQLDSISTYFGYSGSDFFTGTVVTANTIALSEYRISASGNVNGACNISPNLSITITIYQPVQGLIPESQRGTELFSLTRMLVAYRSKDR